MTRCRMRAAAFVVGGHSCRAAADISSQLQICLEVDAAAAVWLTGSGGPGRQCGMGKIVALAAFSARFVEARPDITMPELAARLLTEHSVSAAAKLSRLLCSLGSNRKKSRCWLRKAHELRCEPRRILCMPRQPRICLPGAGLVMTAATGAPEARRKSGMVDNASCRGCDNDAGREGAGGACGERRGSATHAHQLGWAEVRISCLRRGSEDARTLSATWASRQAPDRC